jgi:predicted glutamine amidotransferase
LATPARRSVRTRGGGARAQGRGLMCRLFGFRSVIQSAVHRSLVEADNALAVQSAAHRDGWGVAFYVAGAPHLIKGLSPAVEDKIFSRVSGVVASETVVAHLRQATTGDVNTLNAHPFQFGRWVFAHNGKVTDFEKHRAALRRMVAPNLARYILGDTDSELLFYLFLSDLARRTDLHRKGVPVATISAALHHVVELVRERCDAGAAEPSLLTFLVTDGHSMVGLKYGKPLLFSTYKSRCSERDTCPFLDEVCEAPTADGHVNHLIISSEQLQGENQWIELQDGEIIAVDWRMTLHRGAVDGAVTRVGEALAAS